MSYQTAKSICMSIQIPGSNPPSDEAYFPLLSAFDSNGSYDQIGFGALDGAWATAYSWSTANSTGNLTYYSYEGSPDLSLGATYAFNITATGSLIDFLIFEGSTQIWSKTINTGGTQLVLNYYFYLTGWNYIYPDYTDYEEVFYTDTGAPNFLFNFTNQYWVSTNGTVYAANSWQFYYVSAPSSVAVAINSNSVAIDNHPPNNPTLSGAQIVFTNVQYQYTTNAVTDPDFGDQIRYHINFTGPGTSFQQTTVWLNSGTPLNVGELMPYLGTYLLQVWVEDLAGQLSNMASLSINAVEPLCALKTLTNGYFYVPNPAYVDATYLRVEMLFNESSYLTGDQTGGSIVYPAIGTYPDGKVDIRDIAFIAKEDGLIEGNSGWNYMADVYPDRKIDIRDISQASRNFGKVFGSYINDTSGVAVTFSTGGGEEYPDANGFLAIPAGATSFNVTQAGAPIGAMIIFCGS
jgi:hypothetical protein